METDELLYLHSLAAGRRPLFIVYIPTVLIFAADAIV